MSPIRHQTFLRALSFRVARPFPTRRLLSTAPPSQKSRSWKSSATRWGLAIGGIYYYNTSDIFAEEPPFSPSLARPADKDAPMPTLESLALQRTQVSSLHSASPEAAIAELPSPSAATTVDPSFEDAEEEASQEGAFNEETGEINWDCPCLGGMAHGPCGEEFRAAFSCFVYSKEEPKGMDCIDRFKGMQDCFRQHPETYGDELADPGPDDDRPEEVEVTGAVDSAVKGIAEDAPISPVPDASAKPEPVAALNASSEDTETLQQTSPPPATLSSPTPTDAEIHPAHTTDDDDALKTARAKSAATQVAQDHKDSGEGGDDLVPKEWHDAKNMKEGK